MSLSYAIIPVPIIFVVLNVCALVILCTTKNLKRNRFNCLVLYLSVSDTAIGVQTFIKFTINSFAEGEIQKYICSVLGTFSTATTLFSMYQVLLICIERLNATYSVPNTHLKRVTSDRAVIFGFLLFQFYPLAICVYEIVTNETLCFILPTVVNITSIDTPIVAMTTVIIILYILTLLRIKKQQNKIRELTETALNRIERMKRNMITLGIIVFVTVTILVPRPIAAIIAFSAQNQMSRSMLKISTYLLVLNPIVDPLIYVFRIKTFRQRLFCCHTMPRQQIIITQATPYNSLHAQQNSENVSRTTSTNQELNGITQSTEV